jgi:ABC-2 type transport system permease protein
MEDLSDGSVSPDADILAVVAPHRLAAQSLFAIDQFLMRGGTVVIATSPYTVELSDGELSLQDWDSGLQAWLEHFGIAIEESLVLDQQHAMFPAPVVRRAGEYKFRDVQMIDYPYFVDLRTEGLARNHPITASLPQLTMAWASPVAVDRREGLQLTTLITSSPRSWLSDSMNITPGTDQGPDAELHADASYSPHKLGVMLQGRFNSYFNDLPHFADANSATSALLQRSPESARLVLFSSNDFIDDQMLNAQVMASGTQYLGPVELLLNTLDWSLEDDELLQVRSRAHFNRTLPPMERRGQATIEYLNYAVATLWLFLLYLIHRLRGILRKRRYTNRLGL